MDKRISLQKILMYLFLLLMALIFAAPMAFTLLSSFKTKREIFSAPFSLPEIWQWKNYLEAWEGANMSRYFLNSLIQAGLSVIILAIISTMAAYVLSRFAFRINGFIVVFFLLGMMIPMHTVIVPISYMIGVLKLSDNILALVLVYVAFNLPFTIVILTNYMKGVNKSLEEASLMDGATYFQIYRHVMLPLTKPAIATVSIFNFLNGWNNVLFPLLFIKNRNLKPIALGILNFNGERGTEYGLLMAAIIITVTVPMIFYLLFQEKVESGLAAGAVKE